MLPAKYQPNRPNGSGEEDFFKGFYHIWVWRLIESRIKMILAIFVPPSTWRLHMKLVTFGPVVSEE